MPTVRETARITTDRARDKTVAEQAWLVWRAMHSRATDRAHPPTPLSSKQDGGARGWRYVGSVKSVILSLFPELTALSEDALADITKPIYGYLKTSGNARHVVSQGARSPVWWVRDEWVDSLDAGPSTSGSVPVQAVAAPAFSTPAPSPVPVPPLPAVPPTSGPAAVAEPPKRRQSYDGARAALRQLAEQRREAYQLKVELTRQLLAEIDEPVTVREISYVIGVHTTTVHTILMDLARDNAVHSRMETPEERIARVGGTRKGRRSMLYWRAPVVPARTKREVVNGYVENPSMTAPTTPSKVARAVVLEGVSRMPARVPFSLSQLMPRLALPLARPTVQAVLNQLVAADLLKQVRLEGAGLARNGYVRPPGTNFEVEVTAQRPLIEQYIASQAAAAGASMSTSTSVPETETETETVEVREESSVSEPTVPSEEQPETSRVRLAEVRDGYAEGRNQIVERAAALFAEYAESLLGAEVERERDELRTALEAVTAERDALRAQLAELRKILGG